MFGTFLNAVLYTQDKNGRVTCKRCGKSWKFMSETKHRRCIYCHKALYPPALRKDQCHSSCKGKLCYYLVIDYMIAKQVWWATPGSRGIVWKLAKAVPVDVRELREKFNVSRFSITSHFLRGEALQELVRKGHKKILGPGRPILYGYYPTHWAMVRFLERHEDAVKMLEGRAKLWQPMTIQRDKTLVKFTPIILPRTLEEKQEILKKRRTTSERHNRQMGYPLMRYPES